MGLAGKVGHIGLHNEVVEHCLAVGSSRQHHRHVDGKGAVVSRLGFALVNHLFCQTAAHIAILPIARPIHPPEGYAAAHDIMHLRALYGHAAIGLRTSLGMYDVASLINFLMVRKFDLKSGALILLNTETDDGALCADGETTV